MSSSQVGGRSKGPFLAAPFFARRRGRVLIAARGNSFDDAPRRRVDASDGRCGAQVAIKKAISFLPKLFRGHAYLRALPPKHSRAMVFVQRKLPATGNFHDGRPTHYRLSGSAFKFSDKPPGATLMPSRVTSVLWWQILHS